MSQLRPSLAVSALKVLIDEGRGDQTVKHYATAWKSFSRWAWKDRRTRTDMLADLELPKVVTTSKRSALTFDQASQLIETTRRGPRRRGMTGEDRAWLYTLAAITGLRRCELQSLTPSSFSLEGNPPVVSLPGRDTKNSDDAIQPLPSHVVPSLRSWLAGKPVDKPLWAIPVVNSSLMIKTDLKAAGIAPEAFDFHCLRHSYVSAIVQCGGSVKDSMELARHHDADLTFNQQFPACGFRPENTLVGTISQHIICSGQLFAQFFRSHPEELPEAQRGQLQAQQAVRRLILSVPGPELV